MLASLSTDIILQNMTWKPNSSFMHLSGNQNLYKNPQEQSPIPFWTMGLRQHLGFAWHFKCLGRLHMGLGWPRNLDKGGEEWQRSRVLGIWWRFWRSSSRCTILHQWVDLARQDSSSWLLWMQSCHGESFKAFMLTIQKYCRAVFVIVAWLLLQTCVCDI